MFTVSFVLNNIIVQNQIIETKKTNFARGKKMSKRKSVPKTQSVPTPAAQNTSSIPIGTGNTTSQSSTTIMSFQSVSTSLINITLTLLNLINAILMAIVYFLLVFQTIYILNSKQPKYINLRHIALKWLACMILMLIKQGLAENMDVNSQLVVIIINLLSIAIAYPSRALKAIHLKYFSHKEQQRYQDSVIDPRQYDVTFSSKIFISLAVFLLTLSRHIIALVLPQHRRPIEDSLRLINTVVIDGKCFWSIYGTQKGQQQQQQKSRATLKQYLVSGSTLSSPSSQALLNSPPTSSIFQTTVTKQRDAIRAYGEKCSNIISNGFKPVKRVSIKYSFFDSKLEILDLDFAKVQTYILEQLLEREGNVLEFTVFAPGQKIAQPVYVKFKNSRELEIFVKAIEDAEKNF